MLGNSRPSSQLRLGVLALLGSAAIALAVSLPAGLSSPALAVVFAAALAAGTLVWRGIGSLEANLHEQSARAARAEADLHESERQMQLIGQAVSEGLWEWDVVTGTVVREASLLEAFGYTPGEDRTDASWYEARIHPDDLPRIRASYQAALEGTAETWTTEYRFLRADGSYAHIVDRAIVVRDDSGRAVRMIGAMLDVTQQRTAEQALRESERRLRLAVQTANLGLWEYDLLAGQSYHSPEWKRLIGYEDYEISDAAEEWEARVHPDDVARVKAEQEAWFESGARDVDVEYRLRHKDGSYRSIVSRSTMVRDEDGKPVRLLGLHLDITERKQMEQELRKLASIVATSNEFIGLASFDGTVLYVNTGGRRLVGLGEDDDVTKLQVFDFFDDEEGERVRNELMPRVKAGGHWEGESWFRHFQTGERVPVYQIGFAIEDEHTGAPIALANISVHIGERVEAEAALRDRLRQMALVNELGQLALEGGDLSELMDHAVRFVAVGLDVEYCEVLELLPDRAELLLRAGVGWQSGLVGRATVSADLTSQAGFTLGAGEPVVVEDLRSEARFARSHLLADHRVRSSMTVAIGGPDGPWGIMGAHTAQLRSFGSNDVDFLQSIANILATAIVRLASEQALLDSRERLRTFSTRLQSVREAERARIARDLHDELGQLLTVLKIDLAGIGTELSDETGALARRTSGMLALVDSTIASVRRIATDLRPGILDTFGLVAALEWLVQDVSERTALRCEFVAGIEEVDLDRDRATAVFRIVQEALTNVVRHAAARTVTVELEVVGEDLEVVVRDDGRGITPGNIEETTSLGIPGIVERARAFGGSVEISGNPAQGTSLRLRMPLASSPHSVEHV